MTKTSRNTRKFARWCRSTMKRISDRATVISKDGMFSMQDFGNGNVGVTSKLPIHDKRVRLA